jgi:hypothetical protein
VPRSPVHNDTAGINARTRHGAADIRPNILVIVSDDHPLIRRNHVLTEFFKHGTGADGPHTWGLLRRREQAVSRSHNRCAARHSYRYFSESASACSMSAIVSSGIRSWASVTSAEVGWASAGSHCSGFQAPLRSSALGQCG